MMKRVAKIAAIAVPVSASCVIIDQLAWEHSITKFQAHIKQRPQLDKDVMADGLPYARRLHSLKILPRLLYNGPNAMTKRKLTRNMLHCLLAYALQEESELLLSSAGIYFVFVV